MSDGPNRVINFAKFRYVKNDLFDQMKPCKTTECCITGKKTFLKISEDKLTAMSKKNEVIKAYN